MASRESGVAMERTPDASAARPSTPCLHCGQRCAAGSVIEEDRNFCCVGCQAVYSLLTGNGLGQFYDLASNPGLRVGQVTGQPGWAFLDDATVQEKLLDFADARRAKVTLSLPGIHCIACVWLLENLFRLRPGVGESRVNFSQRTASITYNPTQVKLSEIAALVASLGYEPALTLGTLGQDDGTKAPRWQQRQWLQVGVAGFGFGNVMLLALPGYLGLDSASGPWFSALAGWLGLALALPVVVYSAGDYWRAAWVSLRRQVLTLDVPIALGLAAIFGQSVYEVSTGRGVGYSDSLTGLIFFLLCGRLFQRKSFDRLAFDRDYKGFFPLAVVRRTSTGEESVAISGLAVGDRLRIRHAELVPADARLLSGEARVDYSFVTGESEPVTRGVGELIYAGGRQVGGAIEIKTVKPVSESYLTSLWDHEAFAKPRSSDFESQTDRYSRRFTRIVVGVAMLSAVYWLFADASLALKAFASVLIVACPCALALAAPLTLGTAQRWLARRNVFLRNAQVIESLAEVDTIVLDKTGTLTSADTGVATWSGPPLSALEKGRLGSMARHSAHPLAIRISEAIGRKHSAEPVETFLETSGCGMEGKVAGRDILMGSAAWLQSRGTGAAVRPLQHDGSETFPSSGSTAGINGAGPPGHPFSVTSNSSVHVAVDGDYRGCFFLQNTLRAEVEALLPRLRGRYPLMLLSGDNARENDRFRALLGTEAVIRFNQSPLDKLEAIRRLQAAGRKVMMVGDGLNDAGALKQADVGVAVVEKVGTFSPASDIILEAAQLPRLAEVMAFSLRAARVVRAGFIVSGLYNAVGISIAAAGLLSPLVCAILMPLSSVTVVLFAIGTTRWMAWRTFGNSPAEITGNANGATAPGPGEARS